LVDIIRLHYAVHPPRTTDQWAFSSDPFLLGTRKCWKASGEGRWKEAVLTAPGDLEWSVRNFYVAQGGLVIQQLL